MLLMFFRLEYHTTHQLSCSYPSLIVYSKILCAFKNDCSYSLRSDLKAILPVWGKLEDGSFPPHPIYFVCPSWQPTTGHPGKQTSFASPLCHSADNAECSPLQLGTVKGRVAKDKGSFPPRRPHHRLYSPFPRPSHYFFPFTSRV